MTNTELVSRIVNDVRALNKDEHISRRSILHIAKNKAKFLISQKLRDKSLYREDNLFSTIKCFNLKKDDIVKCDIIEFRKCSSIMKSKSKLPELVFSKFGSSIVSVTTIDGMTEFLPMNLTKYRLNTKRRFSKFISQNYYYVRDGYLYLPDTEIKSVDVTLLTLNTDEVEEVSGCSECDPCKSIWESEFICSDKLLEAVIQDTLQEVLSTFRQITPDENPNMTELQRDKTTI